MGTSGGWKDVTPAQIERMGRQKGSRTAQDAIRGPNGKLSKYRNVRVEIDGHRFDSKREAGVYQELKARQAAGEIRNLRLQVEWPLFAPIGETDARVLVSFYVADFCFEELQSAATPFSEREWKPITADCKGGRNTQMFALKKKWLFLQSGIEIREIR